MRILAREQAAAEDCLAREANRLLVCDTNLLTTLVWHQHYFGACPPELRQLPDERTADLNRLCETGGLWLAGGPRDSRGHREWFQDRFRSEVKARGLSCVLLSGSSAERLAAAIGRVAPLLDG
jgi:HTH-type transcriptional repressor of NAD biosynthesis genes